VATDATLTKSELKKVAEMAHDGLARAIRPVHTQFDGDTVFAVSTGFESSSEDSSPGSGKSLNSIGVAAAKALELAIIDGVKAAESMLGVVASKDW
jgi:L-aminopeptidase/D-esterase-like protein